MPRYKYKVVPAPQKGVKAKGMRTPEARFSLALQGLMNDLAAEGWEYQRAETLPSTERAGLTGSTTEWRNVLVFRRVAAADADDFRPERLPAPADSAMPLQTATEIAQEGTPEQALEQPSNDLEDTTENDSIGASLSQLAAKRNAVKSAD